MSNLGIENLSPAVKYVIAFVIIFAMLVLLALILRRLTGGRATMASDRGRARQPRLGIVDVYDLDRQRQLILLRRDNVEHLLLVGGPNDVVVETNIVRVAGARVQPATAAEPVERGDVQDRNVEIAPVRPVIEAGIARPADRLGDASVGGHLGPAAAVAAGPEPAYRDPVLKPTRVNDAPQPNLPATDRAAPRPSPPARGAAQPNGSGGMNDVTRQLEDALRRPEPAPPPPRPAPAPAPAPRAPQPDAQAPRPRAPEPRPPEPPPRPPRPAPAPQPPAPPPAPARPATPPATPTAAATGTSPPGKSDPFSIEDIEAEFARLLGRPIDKQE